MVFVMIGGCLYAYSAIVAKDFAISRQNGTSSSVVYMRSLLCNQAQMATKKAKRED